MANFPWGAFVPAPSPTGKYDDKVGALSGTYATIGGRGAPFQNERVFIPRPSDTLFGYFDRKMGRGRMLR